MGVTNIDDDVFLAFAGDRYYPEGGARDLVGIATNRDDTIDKLLAAKRDWGNVLHVTDGTANVVFDTRRP